MSIGVSASNVAPGWYADPLAPGQARWWSGRDWTHHVQPLASIPRPGSATGSAPGVDPVETWDSALLLPRERTLPTRALVWGIVAVVVDPLLAPSILAIVYGVLALRRSRRLVAQGALPIGSGRAIAGIVLGALGAVVAVFWIALVVTSAPPRG